MSAHKQEPTDACENVSAGFSQTDSEDTSASCHGYGDTERLGLSGKRFTSKALHCEWQVASQKPNISN